ncbi:opsin 7, group member a [Lampris incognitus]|uniref:opsin 7, group member a n=1 Tax=Lampris incognitus TaxID=2546036 RepID=UPI0024B55C9D|nr:opsin 7, group member a [Lampris incognitus]
MVPGADDTAFHSNVPVAVDVAVAIIYSVFGVCSVFGNGTLLYVSHKKKQPLKPAELFIVNLAVSDVCLTLSLYPMAITSSFSHRWLYGETVCYTYAFCGMLFGLCSLTTLTMLSMVCFLKVCYPLYGNRFNTAHGCLLIACTWAYALLFACAPLAHWGEYGPEPYGTACCIDWSLSNQRSEARSYTVALFVFCYILPCCAIAASYTGIAVMVRSSRKTMEQHTARKRHMTNIQTVIVKLSVAVCIGFLAAWSPYAVVSMWATFGHVENIPPLAFAMPAMFAKSSTIYNPIINLMLRPNLRKVMCRDLGKLRRACLRVCLCSLGPEKFHHFKPMIRPGVCTICRQTDQVCSANASVRTHAVGAKVGRGCERCSDTFECFRQYPRVCHIASPVVGGETPENLGVPPPEPRTNALNPKRACRKTFLRNIPVRRKQTSEIDNLQINLELVPGHTKVAWP